MAVAPTDRAKVWSQNTKTVNECIEKNDAKENALDDLPTSPTSLASDYIGRLFDRHVGGDPDAKHEREPDGPHRPVAESAVNNLNKGFCFR